MNRDVCVVKISGPGTNFIRACGMECEYRTPERDGSRYAGWYHIDESITDHHAVPKRWVDSITDHHAVPKRWVG